MESDGRFENVYGLEEVSLGGGVFREDVGPRGEEGGFVGAGEEGFTHAVVG